MNFVRPVYHHRWSTSGAVAHQGVGRNGRPVGSLTCWLTCQWGRIDPTRPIKKWDSAWRSLTRTAGLMGLRFHELRRAIVKERAERGVPYHVMMGIAGHLSRKALECYCRVRLDASRKPFLPCSAPHRSGSFCGIIQKPAGGRDDHRNSIRATGEARTLGQKPEYPWVSYATNRDTKVPSLASALT